MRQPRGTDQRTRPEKPIWKRARQEVIPEQNQVSKEPEEAVSWEKSAQVTSRKAGIGLSHD